MTKREVIQTDYFVRINRAVGWHDEQTYKAILKREVNRSFRSQQPLTQIVLKPNLDTFTSYKVDTIEKFLVTVCAIIEENTRNIDVKSIHDHFEVNLLLVDTALDGAKRFIEKCINAIIAGIEHSGNQDYLNLFKNYTYTSYPLNQIAGTSQMEASPVFINNFDVSSDKDSDVTKINFVQTRRLFLNWRMVPNSAGALAIDNAQPFFHYFNSRNEKIFKIQKRVLDIIGALIGLLFLAPVGGIVSLMVRLTSRGPIFFKQKRIGQGGEPFTFLKFRTMYVDNDDEIHKKFVQNLINGQHNGSGNGHLNGNGNSHTHSNGNGKEKNVYKIVNDPRVTRIGGFLRKTSLDELPQFFNVLKGDMSLVGPRPPVSYEVSEYKNWHTRRLQEAKPGITGMWQVYGRSSTTFNEMVRLDIKYLDNWSIWLDLKILFLTIPSVLKGRGAV